MKLIIMFTAVLLYVCCHVIENAEAAFDYNVPIKPKVFRNKLGHGFATNWFKTQEPLSDYNKSNNVKDVYKAGFRNLRLRCRADLLNAPYTDQNSVDFFDELEEVVNDCLEKGVYPVISWIHHHAEAFASEDDKKNYLAWWKKVAEKLKNKDYRLSFNLFTELGVDECQKTNNCSYSLKEDTKKYNNWTAEVVDVIRKSGGNNAKRILILTSPKKTAKGLKLIDKTIFEKDDYMMAEFHIYASGPNKKDDSPKYWMGNGTAAQRQTLIDELNTASTDISLYTYFGAWMPQDNKDGSLTQEEVENFARYFMEVMEANKIPTSLNVLDVYYDTAKAEWINITVPIKGRDLNMASVLNVIKQTMA